MSTQGLSNRPDALFIRSAMLQRAALAGIIALAVINIWGMRPYVVSPLLTANDLTADYVSAREWLDGGDPYGPLPVLIEKHLGEDAPYFVSSPGYQRNAHPPILIVLLTPLALLPFDAARGTVLVLMAALFVGSTTWLACRLRWHPMLSAIVGIGVLSVPVVQSDLLFGQVNAVVLVLMLVTWSAMRKERHTVAGAALGVATALKFFPALFLLVLLRERRWRTAGVQVATALGLTVIGSVVLGIDATRRFVTPASTESAAYWGPAPHNKSLTSIPGRWLTDNFWFDTGVDLPVLAGIVTAAILLACGIALTRSRAQVSGDRFWSAVPWVLLAAPLLWDHYLVLMLPIAFFVIARAGRVKAWQRRAAIIAAAITMLGNVPASTIFSLSGLSDVSVTGQVGAWAMPTYALLALAIIDLGGRDADRTGRGGVVPPAGHGSASQER